MLKQYGINQKRIINEIIRATKARRGNLVGSKSNRKKVDMSSQKDKLVNVVVYIIILTNQILKSKS